MSNRQSNWRIVPASVTGTSHHKQDLPCQDNYNYKTLSQDILLVAVADGAGSAKLSDIGSKVASQTAIDAISQQLISASVNETVTWKDCLTEALKAAQMAVQTEATVHEALSRDLATTLILVVATPELVAVAQVGDGAAVVADDDGKITALTQPEQGEYLNETKFLICPDAIETAQVTIWQGQPAHLAVFSDGLQMLALKMPDATPHRPFFTPLFRFVASVSDPTEAQEQLEAFLRSPRVTERTDDDLTLILANFER